MHDAHSLSIMRVLASVVRMDNFLLVVATAGQPGAESDDGVIECKVE